MAEVLIVAGEKNWDALRALFCPEPGIPVMCLSTAGEARRAAGLRRPGVVLINAPLADEFGPDLALTYMELGCDVIFLSPAAQAGEVARRLEPHGVFVLEKPISRQTAQLTIRLVQVSRKRLSRLEEQNRKLQQRLEDLRQVSRAKCLLVGREALSEEEAHHRLEKLAMDSRVSLREAALDVIRLYGP